MATVDYDAHDESGSPCISREFAKGMISIETDMVGNESD
jgi:hypothetical protein